MKRSKRRTPKRSSISGSRTTTWSACIRTDRGCSATQRSVHHGTRSCRAGRCTCAARSRKSLDTPTVAVHNVIEEVLVGEGKAQQVVSVVATNAYVKTTAGWKMVLHHASQANGGQVVSTVGAARDTALSAPRRHGLRARRSGCRAGTCRRSSRPSWCALPRVEYRRERWDTPDGDFIDVDFAHPEPADAAAPLLRALSRPGRQFAQPLFARADARQRPIAAGAQWLCTSAAAPARSTCLRARITLATPRRATGSCGACTRAGPMPRYTRSAFRSAATCWQSGSESARRTRSSSRRRHRSVRRSTWPPAARHWGAASTGSTRACFSRR